MLHVPQKMPYDRRRMAYRLSQMIKLSFQHTASFLNLHPTTSLFPTVSRGPIVAHNPLFEFKTPHISKFSWSWVKHYYRGLTDVKDLHARIVYVIVTSRTSTPISLQSRVFCSKFSFHFWLHKGRFRSGLGSNNHHVWKGQDAILNLSK